MGQQAMLARGIAIGHTGCEVELVVDRDCHVIPYELALPLLAHLGHELVDFLGEDARLPIDGLIGNSIRARLVFGLRDQTLPEIVLRDARRLKDLANLGRHLAFGGPNQVAQHTIILAGSEVPPTPLPVGDGGLVRGEGLVAHWRVLNEVLVPLCLSSAPRATQDGHGHTKFVTLATPPDMRRD